MKRFTPVELCALILGIVLVAVGLCMDIWPQAAIVPHFVNDALGLSAHSEPEVVTKSGSRIYGILAVAAGAIVINASIYRGKQ